MDLGDYGGIDVARLDGGWSVSDRVVRGSIVERRMRSHGVTVESWRDGNRDGRFDERHWSSREELPQDGLFSVDEHDRDFDGTMDERETVYFRRVGDITSVALRRERRDEYGSWHVVSDEEFHGEE